MYQYNHKFLTTKEHSFNDKEEVICLSSDDEVGRMFLFAKGKSPPPTTKAKEENGIQTKLPISLCTGNGGTPTDPFIFSDSDESDDYKMPVAGS